MRSASPWPVLGAGHLRDHRTVSGVDQDLGDHRLPAGPIGKHNSGETAAGIDENVSRIAAQQEVHPGRDERRLQGLFHTHRGGHGPACKYLLGQLAAGGLVAPEAERGRLVLAKIGPGGGQEDTRTPLGRLDGGCHRAQRAAHHQHVGLADNGNLPLALRNAPRRRTERHRQQPRQSQPQSKRTIADDRVSSAHRLAPKPLKMPREPRITRFRINTRMSLVFHIILVFHVLLYFLQFV